MFGFSDESTKTSHSSVLSSCILGLWTSSHLSNQISKMVTAECAERSAAPVCGVLDHLQELARSSSSLQHLVFIFKRSLPFNVLLQFLCSILASFLVVLEVFFSPPLSSPLALRISPGRPRICRNPSLPFDLQNRIRNFSGFLNAFWLPKSSPKPPNMEPSSSQNPSFVRLRFPAVFPSVSDFFC